MFFFKDMISVQSWISVFFSSNKYGTYSRIQCFPEPVLRIDPAKKYRSGQIRKWVRGSYLGLKPPPPPPHPQPQYYSLLRQLYVLLFFPIHTVPYICYRIFALLEQFFS
jgi:hypothetical protein